MSSNQNKSIDFFLNFISDNFHLNTEVTEEPDKRIRDSKACDAIATIGGRNIAIEHTSIDWNGEHGSLSRDLRKPLWDEFGTFSMVTNFGTTEHVDGQAGVWENIHRMTEAGGIYVGLTPYHDGKSWWWHGEWYPTEAFFESFAELNGWEIERMHVGLEVPHQFGFEEYYE